MTIRWGGGSHGLRRCAECGFPLPSDPAVECWKCTERRDRQRQWCRANGHEVAPDGCLDCEVDVAGMAQQAADRLEALLEDSSDEEGEWRLW